MKQARFADPHVTDDDIFKDEFEHWGSVQLGEIVLLIKLSAKVTTTDRKSDALDDARAWLVSDENGQNTI